MTNPQNNESLLIVNAVCREEPSVWAAPLYEKCYLPLFGWSSSTPDSPACLLSQGEGTGSYQHEDFRSLSQNKTQQAYSQFVNKLEYK